MRGERCTLWDGEKERSVVRGRREGLVGGGRDMYWGLERGEMCTWVDGAEVRCVLEGWGEDEME